jgi:hypothetical protein
MGGLPARLPSRPPSCTDCTSSNSVRFDAVQDFRVDVGEKSPPVGPIIEDSESEQGVSRGNLWLQLLGRQTVGLKRSNPPTGRLGGSAQHRCCWSWNSLTRPGTVSLGFGGVSWDGEEDRTWSPTARRRHPAEARYEEPQRH